MKVFLPEKNIGIERMFKTKGWEVVENMEDADLVQFSGGPDVSPRLYDQETHRTTFTSKKRDETDCRAYTLAQSIGIPTAGICRGGQFLNVMAGGSLYQNIDGHLKTHKAYVVGERYPIDVTSTHHQQIIPNEDVDYILLMSANGLGYCKEYVLDGRVHYEEDDKKLNLDVEAIFYPEEESLCFQPHPEYDGVQECTDMYFFFLMNYLF